MPCVHMHKHMHVYSTSDAEPIVFNPWGKYRIPVVYPAYKNSSYLCYQIHSANFKSTLQMTMISK